jgi:hypothetical protein
VELLRGFGLVRYWVFFRSSAEVGACDFVDLELLLRGS